MTLHKTIAKTAAETALAEQFAALPADPDRAAAFQAFLATGLPTRRNEAWHYTDLRSAMVSAAPPAPTPDAARVEAARLTLATQDKWGEWRFVLLNGRFAPELSDAAPSGLMVSTLAKSPAQGERDAVIALNDAFESNGLHLFVDPGVKLTGRIEIAHLASAGSPQAIYSRISATLGPGAEAQIVEHFAGANSADQRNALTRLSIGDGACCAHSTVVEDEAGLHLESQIAELGADARFSAFALIAGGVLVRRQLFVRHRGERAEIALGGLSLLDGKRHADTTLVVDHAAPHGQSREFYKHIIADDAIGVYQGKVIVQPGAQKTDGGMKSQAILLSPQAIMNNKPELEIFADDVVCGHGATVGALDPEQTFYLQARGLPKAEAEAMLLEAFGADAIARVDDEELAELMREKMRAWLAARAEGAH
jgi:Fe-S cluster assembly protein SufD